MPYLSDDLIRHLAGLADADSVVIPEGPDSLEPLHAVYSRGCLAAIEETITIGNKRIVSFFDRVIVKIKADQIARFDPSFASFRNINTPEEYFRMRGEQGSLLLSSTGIGGAVLLQEEIDMSEGAK